MTSCLHSGQFYPVNYLCPNLFLPLFPNYFIYFYHQLRYGEPTLRRAVPLALALISVSNPRLNILDTLSKFSHDADPEVSYNYIFAIGMVGSTTNNARLAAMLRQLAQYHAKDPNNLFMVRLAQVKNRCLLFQVWQ